MNSNILNVHNSVDDCTQCSWGLVLTLVTTQLLSGCDGGDNNSATPSPAFSGTVSTPKGLAETTIELKSINGGVTAATVDENGRYAVQDTGSDERYLMRASLGNDNYLYSIAHLDAASGNRQNIHSYTDLVARTWFADQGLNINSVFTSSDNLENFPTAEFINSIDQNVQAIVSDVLDVYGLAQVTLSKADYDASDTGIDRFLNENPVIIRANRATIIVNDPQTNLQAVAVDRVELQTTFGEIDTTPPEQPQDVRALSTYSPEQGSEIVLAWTVASDNIGVATYEIYRNETLIGHTPFPVYRDSNALADTEYVYTVVTRDESGNRSTPSIATTASPTATTDTTAPEIPSTATLNANTESVDVFWTHANVMEVAGFEVTRTGGTGLLVREVSSSRLRDITVASGTEYCYTIVAVDASGNRSEPNPRSCITTSGAAILDQELSITPATVELAQESISGLENSIVSAYVNRLGDASGEISIDYVITPGTATADEDYIGTDGTLVWTDGDVTAKQIDIQLLPDNMVEGPETLTVVLSGMSTNAVIANATTTIQIVDID